MSVPAIQVEHLCKQYTIGVQKSHHILLSDRLADSLKNILRLRSVLVQHKPVRRTPKDATFLALNDVSLEIQQGELVGIIGRNGAGKSTLLKILSRITAPTKGRAVIHGRIGSLLEVGTGFHPELTGRDNIYLSGTILGMKKIEIDRKFDEIVAFADMEKFLDTPVKHYSSGMYMRLAFAVAAHLEPEILIVDEVLAVGDERFQKKCLNKMQDVGKHGRTVLFVSHNMQAITRLCKRAILLEEGRVKRDGPTHEVVTAYLTSGVGSTACREWSDPVRAPGGEVARLRAVRVRTMNGQVVDKVDIDERFGIEMEFEVVEGGRVLLPTFQFFNEENVYMFSAQDLDPAWRKQPRPIGRYISTAWIPGNLLSEGRVFVDVTLCVLYPVISQFIERSVVAFQVIEPFEGGAARGDWVGEMGGVVRPLLTWTTEFISSDHRMSAILTEETKP